MMYGHVFTAPNDLPELPSADLADRGEMGTECNSSASCMNCYDEIGKE